MTHLATPSPEELAQRRKSLKQQRRIRNLQNIWRVLAATGLAAGAFWMIHNPFWLLLQGPHQVIIDGNEMMTDATIHELLGLQYPQPIFKLQPEAIVARLSDQSPVAFARVNRQLFPPRLEISLQERQPVAITIPTRPAAASSGDPTPDSHPGLLDAEGHWMAQRDVKGLEHATELPGLRVRGFHTRYRLQWPILYQSLQTSPVPIYEIDWRSPNNLILQTEAGIVHLGIYDPQRLQQQLSILPQLQGLTSNSSVPAVEYVDLSNPQVPAVKLQDPLPSAEQTPEETY